MKKIILLSGALCLLTSVSTGAQAQQLSLSEALASVMGYPQSPDWNRRDNNDRYWRQVHRDQELREQELRDQELRDRERAREEARENDRRNNGHHYAYGKDHPKHHGKGYGKNHPKYHGEGDGNDHDKHDNR